MSAITTSRPLGAILRVGLLAALTAAVVNLVIALIGRALVSPPADFRPLQLGAVVGVTFMAVLAGTAVYALIERRTGRADRSFPVVVWVVAGLSLLQPISLLLVDQPQFEGSQPTSVGAALVLMVLHLVPALIIIRFLTGGSARGKDNPA